MTGAPPRSPRFGSAWRGAAAALAVHAGGLRARASHSRPGRAAQARRAPADGRASLRAGSGAGATPSCAGWSWPMRAARAAAATAARAARAPAAAPAPRRPRSPARAPAPPARCSGAPRPTACRPRHRSRRCGARPRGRRPARPPCPHGGGRTARSMHSGLAPSLTCGAAVPRARGCRRPRPRRGPARRALGPSPGRRRPRAGRSRTRCTRGWRPR